MNTGRRGNQKEQEKEGKGRITRGETSGQMGGRRRKKRRNDIREGGKTGEEGERERGR